jgi:hypothetical protein
MTASFTATVEDGSLCVPLDMPVQRILFRDTVTAMLYELFIGNGEVYLKTEGAV